MSSDRRARAAPVPVTHLHYCGHICACIQLLEDVCLFCEMTAVMKRRFDLPELTEAQALARIRFAASTGMDATR